MRVWSQWSRPDFTKRVQETNTTALKVPYVAGHQSKRVNLGSSGDEHIGLFPYDAAHGKLAAQFAGTTANGFGDGHYFVTLKVMLHPGVQSYTGPPGQTEENFLHADDGNKVPFDARRPIQDTRIGFVPAKLADDIGVNEIAHRIRPVALGRRRSSALSAVAGATLRNLPPA